MNARVLFFVGKGGVGKSTNSSLFALKLARSGKQVLLNSIDPAHNLHDIFQTPLGSKPKQIVPGIEAMETDLDQWVKKYLKDTERDFRSVYKYQEAFNLHRYFKTLKYSPGLEEYAVLLALVDTLRRFADRDYIIFDTPPTALTLKFLALPDVSLLWLQELSQFRQLVPRQRADHHSNQAGAQAGEPGARSDSRQDRRSGGYVQGNVRAAEGHGDHANISRAEP